jgi:hypothetical protein
LFTSKVIFVRSCLPPAKEVVKCWSGAVQIQVSLTSEYSNKNWFNGPTLIALVIQVKQVNTDEMQSHCLSREVEGNA